MSAPENEECRTEREGLHEPDGEAGFTLIELLVSLVLLSFLLLVVPSTLRLATRATLTSQDLMTEWDRAAALSLVRRTLSEAMPLVEGDADGKAGIAFAGDATSLTYVAPLENGPQGGGLYRISIGIARGGIDEPSVLGFSLAPYVRTARPGDTPAAVERRALVKGLTGGELRYFGAARGKPGSEWQREWSHRDRLPQLVEIELATSAGSSPPIRVELQLAPRR
jgi:prepilin-type N-terminal cleavage/methylation domain-containing protein